MLRGTTILLGEDAKLYVNLIDQLRYVAHIWGYEEVIVPAIWEQKTFVDKAGEDILSKMYTFKDKGDRDICLIPEVTAVLQEYFKEHYRAIKKPWRVFYAARCYRYDTPQPGRYREFMQFGVEYMGGKSTADKDELIKMSQNMLDILEIEGTKLVETVKRGLSYYIEDGFEIEADKLGTQKQILGGGRYDCGVGFAFGIERLALLMKESGLERVLI